MHKHSLPPSQLTHIISAMNLDQNPQVKRIDGSVPFSGSYYLFIYLEQSCFPSSTSYPKEPLTSSVASSPFLGNPGGLPAKPIAKDICLGELEVFHLPITDVSPFSATSTDDIFITQCLGN